MLQVNKILKPFQKINPAAKSVLSTKEHNFQQFCPNQVCQLVLCDNAK